MPAGFAAMLGLGLATWGIAPLGAQSFGDAATYEGKQHGYTVELPAGCRHEEGPGTIDAVCAPDFDPERSAVADAARTLVLSVAAERLDGNEDASVAGLLERYTEERFKEELPEAVCGEQDKARVRIENVSQSAEGPRIVYSADVICAEIKFLQIGSRRAQVRHVIGPDGIYRLMARAPVEQFAKQRAAIDAFFASFRLTAGGKAEK